MKLSHFSAVLVFAAVLCLFWFGFSAVSRDSQQESRRLLERSIDRAIVNCYAIEGMYPPDFSYLEENYGVHVDPEKYLVDYQVFASNVKPVVQLLDRGNVRLEVRQ